MPRYIDANKIKLTGLTFEDINNEVYFSLSDVRKAIEQTPTADVVEIVMCRECRKKDTEECWCAHWEDDYKTGFGDNGFCAGGERKEQG